MSLRYSGGKPTTTVKEKLIDTQIVVVFCLCDDLLKALRHVEDGQRQMTDAEVMTTAIVAMLYFKGNFRFASQYMCEHGYIPNMLSRSGFNRRLHRMAELFLTLFLRLGEHWKNLNERSVYVIDSCDLRQLSHSTLENLPRRRLSRPYCQQKRYFYGLRIHLMVTEQDQPLEFFLAPGAFSNTRTLQLYQFDVPEQAWITGDKACNDYIMEDLMREAGVGLLPLRKKNSLRLVPPHMSYLQHAIRKVVETTGSLIARLPPKALNSRSLCLFWLEVSTSFGSNLGYVNKTLNL